MTAPESKSVPTSAKMDPSDRIFEKIKGHYKDALKFSSDNIQDRAKKNESYLKLINTIKRTRMFDLMELYFRGNVEEQRLIRKIFNLPLCDNLWQEKLRKYISKRDPISKELVDYTLCEGETFCEATLSYYLLGIYSHRYKPTEHSKNKQRKTNKRRRDFPRELDDSEAENILNKACTLNNYYAHVERIDFSIKQLQSRREDINYARFFRYADASKRFLTPGYIDSTRLYLEISNYIVSVEANLPKVLQKCGGDNNKANLQVNVAGLLVQIYLAEALANFEIAKLYSDSPKSAPFILHAYGGNITSYYKCDMSMEELSEAIKKGFHMTDEAIGLAFELVKKQLPTIKEAYLTEKTKKTNSRERSSEDEGMSEETESEISDSSETTNGSFDSDEDSNSNDDVISRNHFRS